MMEGSQPLLYPVLHKRRHAKRRHTWLVKSPCLGTFTAHADNGAEIGRINVSDDGDHVVTVYVEPQFRRLGVATALYDAAESWAGRILRESPYFVSPECRLFRKYRYTETMEPRG